MCIYKGYWFELGNEMDVPLFGDQVVAMETKAKALGVGGKMHYVYPNGHNYGFFGAGVDTIKHSGVNPRQIVGDLHAADGGACAKGKY